MALHLAIPALTIGLKKRAENRRRKAASNAYSNKYPLLDDCNTMKASIDAAVQESKSIDKWDAKTAGEKRIKSRNSAALRSWLIVMREHLRDLTCGINVASTQTGVVSGTDAKPTVLPAQKVEIAQITPETNVQNAGNIAASTKKKGVNWLLIGGIGIGVFLAYKLIKK